MLLVAVKCCATAFSAPSIMSWRCCLSRAPGVWPQVLDVRYLRGPEQVQEAPCGLTVNVTLYLNDRVGTGNFDRLDNFCRSAGDVAAPYAACPGRATVTPAEAVPPALLRCPCAHHSLGRQLCPAENVLKALASPVDGPGYLREGPCQPLVLSHHLVVVALQDWSKGRAGAAVIGQNETMLAALLSLSVHS